MNDEKDNNAETPEAPSLNQYFSFHVKLSGKITYLLEFFSKKDLIEIQSKCLEDYNPPIYRGIFS